MATRTISNTGGNYNSTASWVEGVVPTSADDVVATATSGQLTVNVASAASTFNFTNYANTLTVNTTWTVSGVATQSFVLGMTISGSGNIALTGAGATIKTNGKTIPNLSITGNKILGDTLNVGNITSTSTCVWSGNQSINCTGNMTFGNLFFNEGTGSTFSLTGVNQTVQGIVGFTNFIINSSGTINVSQAGNYGIGLYGAVSGNTYTMKWISGTLSGYKSLHLECYNLASTNTLVLDTSPVSWNNIDLLYAPNTFTLRLDSDLNWTGSFTGLSPINTNGLLINGIGKLNGGAMVLYPIRNTLSDNKKWTIKFGSTSSHILSQLLCTGDLFGNTIIQSQTASTTAFLGITGTNSIMYTTFTDINATAGPFKTLYSTLTRTTNITNYTAITSGGPSSYTYIQ